jgi:hypothetical protein
MHCAVAGARGEERAAPSSNDPRWLVKRTRNVKRSIGSKGRAKTSPGESQHYEGEKRHDDQPWAGWSNRAAGFEPPHLGNGKVMENAGRNIGHLG